MSGPQPTPWLDRMILLAVEHDTIGALLGVLEEPNPFEGVRLRQRHRRAAIQLQETPRLASQWTPHAIQALAQLDPEDFADALSRDAFILLRDWPDATPCEWGALAATLRDRGHHPEAVLRFAEHVIFAGVPALLPIYVSKLKEARRRRDLFERLRSAAARVVAGDDLDEAIAGVSGGAA